MKWIKKKKCDECKKEQGCSDCKKYQDKAFELEVDEELQNERLTEWWKKYSWTVYGGVAAVLLTTAGAQWYQAHHMKVRLSESDAFEKASILAHTGKNGEAVEAFDALAKSAKTGYRVLALINLADLQLANNQKEEGLKTLQKVLDITPKNDPLHLSASLTYVGYQMDGENTEELLKVLEPALKETAFKGLATELAVPLLNKKGEKEKAQKLIQEALQNPETSENSKARLNTLKGV